MAPNCILQTSMGDVAFELYDEHAPKTCRNFRELCKRGYYSGASLRSSPPPRLLLVLFLARRG